MDDPVMRKQTPFCMYLRPATMRHVTNGPIPDDSFLALYALMEGEFLVMVAQQAGVVT